MVESKSSNEGKRRLSILTDIMLLIPIIIGTVAIIKSIGISSSITSSSETLSLEAQTNFIQEENDKYIEKIEEEFGMVVMYGKNVAPFVKKLDAVAQYDENIINNNLKIIYNSLKKYPIEAFNMSISKENPTYIMLVDHFENNNIALASRNNLDEYRIYLSNAEKLERALHHEMYHVLEYYMSKNGKSLFKDWNKLNPEGFVYNVDISNLNNEYVYNQVDEIALDNNSEKISINNEYYFVTRYSKTSEKEDRAEIFAELMMLQYSPSYLTRGQNIRKKVEYIFSVIKSNITYKEFYCNTFL